MRHYYPRVLTWLILAAASLLAQENSTVTRIGSHQLGERLPEWLAAAHLSGDGVCPARRQEVGNACKELIAARGEVADFIKRVEEKGCERDANSAGESCDREMSEITSGRQGKIVFVHDDKEYEWQFIKGKLSELTLTTPSTPRTYREPETAQEVKFLTQAYGHPTKTEMVPYQNAYGARWNCVRDTWLMPDGGSIVAFEHIANTAYGPARVLTIVFLSRDELEREAQQDREKTNPYRH